MKASLKIVPFLFFAASMLACAGSLQYAHRFVMDETDIHVLVLPPPALIKTFSAEHPDSVPASEFSGPDHPGAQFVGLVDDSLFIARFMHSLRYHLDLLHINHYGPDQLDEFFSLEKPAYLFVLAQMELFEYQEEEVFVGRSGYTRYVGRTTISVLENNVWFEFMKRHDPDFEMEVLFGVHATSDYVEGRFVRMRDGSVRFDPQRYPLSEEDLYDLAYFSAKQQAQNIFDHLLNVYLRERAGRDPGRYYHYDMEEHVIREKDHPPFIRITPPAGEEDEPQD